MMDRRQFVQACAVMLGSSVIITGCGSDGGTSDNSFDSGSSLSRNRWEQLPSIQFIHPSKM